MDKYEYKVRADEIKELIATGDYAEAADIADTIDWRRVKSVMMLCTISDLYKINRRYEDAKNMLLLAYERRPGGKTICYSLCELCIKTEEYVQAINYYKEFVQVAPKDPGRYILQYKLYEAQDVGLEERIGVLEELKKRDYREKWAYELAYLYHRVGLATRCVEECDELILWFGEGKYVIKAMELKMLHEPLTESQQEKYNRRFQKPEAEKPEAVPDAVSEQEALREVWEGVLQTREAEGQRTVYPDPEQPPVRSSLQEEEADGMDIQVKTMDVGRFNTINLQAELAEGLKEVLAEEQKNVRAEEITRSILSPMMDSDTESLTPPEIDEVSAGDFGPEAEVMESSEVFFGATSEIGSTQIRSDGEDDVREIFSQEYTGQDMDENSAEAEDNAEESISERKADETAETVMAELRRESVVTAEEQALKAQPPKELAGVLSQEADGQISLVMPESDAIEKQITGQMSIEDILSEWEKRKKENEAKRQEEVRQHVLEQTGTMFTEFEAAVRDGILAQLEIRPTEEVAGSEEAENAPEAEVRSEESAAGEEAEWAEPEETTGGEEAENATEMEVRSEESESAAGGEAEWAEPEETTDGEEAENATEMEAGSEESAAGGEAEWADSEETTDGEEAENAPEAEAGSEESAAGEEAEWADSEETADGEEAENAPEAEAGSEESAAGEEAEWAEPEETTGGEEAENAPEAEAGSEESADGEEAQNDEQERTDAESVEREQAKVRALTREEKELYAPFIQSRSGKEKLVKAIDSISLAAYTGNIIIAGEEGMDTLSLAKNMIREVQMTDSNFSGRVAKISGQGMNTRNIADTLENLKNGALIIAKASGMERPAAEKLRKILQKENFGIIIVMEDTKKGMRKLLKKNPGLQESFTARLEVEAMSNDSLAAFGRQYARKQEYSIDELGMLALHTRIEERQTIDHVVTVLDVREIVDNAIRHANRKTVGHFFDILFARRYDDEDMIILTEKDFV